MLNAIAHASETTTTAQANPIMGFLPIIIIFAVFYFLIIRPQSKRAKTEQTMRNSIQIGNKVLTTSGIFGTIAEIDNEKGVVSVSLAKDVTVVMYKTSIANVLKDKKEEIKVEKVEVKEIKDEKKS
jgi:preprotein translocase subunit YajC